MSDRSRGPGPLVRPPQLNTGQGRSASQLELFFDLAYVLAVGQLAATLLTDLDWGGVLRFIGLFTIVWLSWVGFTLYANRFDTDDLLMRLSKFAAMAAILGAAASISEATGTHITAFTVSYLLGRLVLLGLYARAWRHVPAARDTIGVYLTGMTLVVGLWAASLFVPAPATLLLWAFAAVIDILTPVLASRRGGQAPLHLEHLPERFGLLVILVLGEVIAAIVTGVHDTTWDRTSVVIAAAAFLTGAAVWWIYFDVGSAISTDSLQRAEEREAHREDPDHAGLDERHDLFAYGHLPLTAGILALGAGVEDLILHPNETLPSVGSWLVTGGIVAVIAGAALLLRSAQQSPTLTLIWPLLAASAVLLTGWRVPPAPTFFALSMAALTVLTATAGTVLARRAQRHLEPAPPHR